jgi:hypothetical protein
MIRAAARSAPLIQRLRARAARIAAARAAALRRRQGHTDWHSAAALWPDFAGGIEDGK